MINVLVVDDSATARSLIMHILGTDPEVRVVGTASNGEEALKAVESTKPHVITMDINMPGMGGLEATRQIMETQPTPIVIVSGLLDTGDAGLTFRALEAGALAVLARPKGVGHPEYATSAEELIRTVKMMSEVKVVRRWPRMRTMSGPISVGQSTTTLPLMSGPLGRHDALATRRLVDGNEQVGRGPVKLVAIGASTGGPPVLRTILSALPPDLAVPIVIVQHIAAGFTQGFVEWLATASNYPVMIPGDGDRLVAGKAYVAPEGMHMGIGPGNRVALSAAPLEHGMRPSVSYLFRSVAESAGAGALGVLLTGMGRDGASELKVLSDLGAVTIAQDFETSVVHGMPGEAILLGGVTYVRPAEKIAELITSVVRSQGQALNGIAAAQI